MTVIRKKKKWKLLLNSNGSYLCEVGVNRDIFQGDSMSPLIFIICMIPVFLFKKNKGFL